MFAGFIDYIQQRTTFTQEELDYVQNLLPLKTFKRGEYLLKEGTISDAFFFNVQGFVRLFYNVEGQEHTAYFYTEGDFVSAYESYVRQTPTTLNFQAIEDTTVVVISRTNANLLLQQSPKFTMLAIAAMEEEMIANQNIIASLLTRSPEERYKKLLSDHQDYFQRIPQHYIASFIGVQPESLSRIKKRYSEGQKS
ncbi:MAG: Crp/Fnr family transcriptional regulator [Flavipsychrobacter sp.]